MVQHEPIGLLRDKISRCDAVLMTVTALGQQQYSGKVEKVYSRRFEGPGGYDVPRLPFIGSTSSWGNQGLVNGERALVFIGYSTSTKRYYQEHWQGHFSVVAIENQLFAIANWHLLKSGGRTWGPGYLRDSAFLPDKEKPGRVAMPYALLERHLLEELGDLKPC